MGLRVRNAEETRRPLLEHFQSLDISYLVQRYA
jgi:hypothetical protein